MSNDIAIAQMQEALELYKQDQTGVKPLFESMRELSQWLKELQESKQS